MITHVEAFLRNGGTVESLLGARGIKSRRHGRYPNLVLLKYDQIASPMSDPLVRECRGIILDEADGWRVVSRAMDKFANHGEGYAATIDWPTARVQTKLDGSLAKLYWYDGAWQVATSGSPDASGTVFSHGTVPGGEFTFADYFWQTARLQCGDGPFVLADIRWCYYFELTGPLNRIIVQHDAPRLTLLGARNMLTQQEASVEDAHEILMAPAIPRVGSHPLGSFAEIAATFGSLSPLSHEGYVVVDGAFNRVKVKHPGYVALHHAKDGLCDKAFVEIARSGETSELVAVFPEIAERLEDAKRKVDALADRLTGAWVAHREAPDQKSFALAVKDLPCSSALFLMRAGKISNVREHLAAMPVATLMRHLGYRDEEAA